MILSLRSRWQSPLKQTLDVMEPPLMAAGAFPSRACAVRMAEETLKALWISFRKRLESNDTTTGSACILGCIFAPVARRPVRLDAPMEGLRRLRARLREWRAPPTNWAGRRLKQGAASGGASDSDSAAANTAERVLPTGCVTSGACTEQSAGVASKLTRETSEISSLPGGWLHVTACGHCALAAHTTLVLQPLAMELLRRVVKLCWPRAAANASNATMHPKVGTPAAVLAEAPKA